MSSELASPAASVGNPPRVLSPTPEWLSWNFALTIFTSAFLLFQVQPIISKYILPWFGGTPAVWTTCMLFFQMVLFCGYLYAHLSQHFLTPRWQGVLHLCLLVGAVVLLPIEPSASWKPTDSSDPVGRILGLLAASVGLPYFLLSATGPLLQSWFSRAYEQRSPYRLYSLSNIGSLLALISYPFLVEPKFDLPTQAKGWSLGYVVFAVICGSAAIWMYRKNYPSVHAKVATDENSSSAIQERPLWLSRMLWILFPAFASVLLMSTINHVCADVDPVPTLVIATLTAYLLSFIICFDHDRWYHRGFWGISAFALVLLLAANLGLYHYWLNVEILDFKQDFIVNILVLFVVAVCCHGEVIRLRPGRRHLTEFYLLISFGGVVGGILVALVAPHVFSRYWEWNISIVGSLLVAGYVLARHQYDWAGNLFPHLSHSLRVEWSIQRWPWLVVAVGLACFWISEPPHKRPIERLRNFFGVVSVREHEKDDPERHHFSFRSGTIDHGKQFALSNKRNTPISYFYPESGAGQSMLHMQQKHPDGVRIGVIGMGVGLLAAYGQKNDYFRFYEINPNVVYLADKYFYFLSDLKARGATYDIELGDGRLSLEREKGNKFNVLYLDAFTGDAPPFHLLTKEAFEIYDRHLADDGIICINAINTYLNIVPVVQQAAKHFGWKVTRISRPKDISEKLYYRTDFITLSRKESDFSEKHPDQLPDADYLEPEYEVPLWTDKYTDLFGILKTK